MGFEDSSGHAEGGRGGSELWRLSSGTPFDPVCIMIVIGRHTHLWNAYRRWRRDWHVGRRWLGAGWAEFRAEFGAGVGGNGAALTRILRGCVRERRGMDWAVLWLARSTLCGGRMVTIGPTCSHGGSFGGCQSCQFWWVQAERMVEAASGDTLAGDAQRFSEG